MVLQACLSTPGISEPDGYICTIITDKVLSCQDAINPNIVMDLKITDAIGFQAVAPKFFAQIKTHHNALHTELNKKCQ